MTLPRSHPDSEHWIAQRRWIDETFAFEEWARTDDAAASAELADELEAYRVLANADARFDDALAEWFEFACDHCIWLVIEQSCWHGVMLPADQMALRLANCPDELMNPFRWFIELCPAHVRHFIALEMHVRVRLDRALRTGSPEWRGTAAM